MKRTDKPPQKSAEARHLLSSQGNLSNRTRPDQFFRPDFEHTSRGTQRITILMAFVSAWAFEAAQVDSERGAALRTAGAIVLQAVLVCVANRWIGRRVV